MGKRESRIQSDEKIIYTTTYHWMYVTYYLSVFVGICFCFFIADYIRSNDLNFYIWTGTAAGLVMLVSESWGTFKASDFTVTDKRIIAVFDYGWKRERICVPPLSDIKEIQVKQSTLGRRLGYGTIVIRLIEGKRLKVGIFRRSTLKFGLIKNPFEFQKQVQALISN